MKVIVLPGWGHTKEMWSEVCMLLNVSGVDIEVWDLPGFGKEPLVSESWSIPDYAVWVESKIKERGYSDVILLGHSFGGRIAAYIASNNPDWLKCVILYAAPGIYRPSIMVRSRSLFNRIFKNVLPESFVSKFRPEELKDAEEKGLGKIFRRAVVFDQTDRLPNIQVPTYILWGENDSESDISIGEEMQRLIPNSIMKVIDKAGHNIYLSNPTLFYGIVHQVLQHFK